jgi:hypothetical protein
VSDAINVFDISRLGDAGCDEIWVRIEDLKPLLSRAGLALVPARGAEPREEREWFCPQCGVTRLGVDEDGCCTDCGATCCRMSELRALLSRAGWVFDEETKTFWHMANFLDPADKGFALTIERMRELLATRGLALVPAADVVTPEERAVLDASLAFPEHALGSTATIIGMPRKQLSDLCWRWEQAVLLLHEARRKAGGNAKKE